MRNEIVEMVKVEEEKFEETIKRGQGMVKRISDELKEEGKKEIPPKTLIELYDSHGLPPEIVKQAAENENVKVEIPDNFYTLIAQRHMQVSKPVEEKNIYQEKIKKHIEKTVPTTLLYYQDPYMKDFEAKVLKVVEKDFIVLDKTCFFPEGGGQPPDSGFLSFNGKRAEVIDVQKVGSVVVHKVKGNIPEEGQTVNGEIDWSKRYSLMKNHTATHVIGGAAKRVLGQHVWQYGTQKGVVSSRLDISHFRRLTLEELHKIEMLANEAVMRNIKIDISWLPRNEAESKYGFRLYQGGAVPGKEIRVVRAGDWDVEACAGTHLKSTGEIGFIKIIHSERVQDGVERLEYSVGIEGVKAVQKNEKLLMKLAETLNAPLDKLDQTAERTVKDLKESNAEKRKLIKELAAKESNSAEKTEASNTTETNGIKIVLRDFKESIDVDRMIQTATEIIKKDEATVTIFYGASEKSARIMVMAGKTATDKGANAGSIVKEAAAVIGGSGGGRPNFAQGGGTQVQNISRAVEKAKETLKGQLKP
jgi:alanyl-tRNA synthetase